VLIQLHIFLVDLVFESCRILCYIFIICGTVVLYVCYRSMVNKPKEFAHLLRDKFGSADQINMLGMCGAC